MFLHSDRMRLYAVSVLLLSFVGCSHGVRVVRMSPAEIGLPGVKRIAVANISGQDGENLSGLIVQGLLDSKRFEVLDRQSLDAVLREQHLSTDAAFADGGVALGRVLAASAVVTGRVIESHYSEDVHAARKTCARAAANGKTEEYACLYNTRTGKVQYIAELKVLDTSTGRITASRTIQEKANDEQSATDQEPAAIDGAALVTQARQGVATAFLHMIAPYAVAEEVSVENDGALPDLEKGNKFLTQGDVASAKDHFAKAVAQSEADPKVSATAKGCAHYSLGLGLALQGDYNGAIEELKKAYDLAPKDAWMSMIQRVKRWQADATKLQKEARMSDGQP